MTNIIFPSTENSVPITGIQGVDGKPTVKDLLEIKGREVIAASQKTSLGMAANILHDRVVGILVVTDSAGRLAGVLSERDIVGLFATIQSAKLWEIPLSEVMTRDVVTCTPEAEILEVLDVMWEHQFRHMPVVENGVVCGVVSRTDILHHLRTVAEADSEEFLWSKLVNQL